MSKIFTESYVNKNDLDLRLIIIFHAEVAMGSIEMN